MLSTCIKLPFVINIFVLSIFEWPLKPACLDPGIFVRGVQTELPENSPDVFLVINLFYNLEGVQLFINGFISEKTILFKGFRGGFSRGGGGEGASYFLFLYRNPYNM